MTDLVEDYLDDLADRLPARGRQLRQTLALFGLAAVTLLPAWSRS